MTRLTGIVGAVAVAVAVVLVVTGCGGQSSSASRPATASRPVSCTIGASGHDAVAWISGGPQAGPVCAAIERQQAKAGNLWVPEDGAVRFAAQSGDPYPASVGDSLTCFVVDPSHQLMGYVWDSGSALYGQNLCTELISSGWTES